MKISLRALRINAGFTLKEASKKLSISSETLRSYENKKTHPDFKKLSEILKISPDMLLGDAEEKQTEENSTAATVKIPVIGTVAAGVPITAQEDITGWEEVPAEWVKNSTMFALKLKGDSMEPRMAEGDIVIVKQQSDVESGEIAIVMVDGEATCKKVVKHSDGVVLVSNNPKYSPMFFTLKDIEEKNITVLGRVTELRVKF